MSSSAHAIQHLLTEEIKQRITHLSVLAGDDLLILQSDEVHSGGINDLANLILAYQHLCEKKEYKCCNDKIYKTERDIYEFIMAQRESLQTLAEELQEIDEIENASIVNELGAIIYQNEWIVNLSTKQSITKKEEDTVILYKAKDGELILKFNDQAQRNKLYQQLEPTEMDPKFRNGEQFKKNKTGLVPKTFPDKDDRLFFISYLSKNKEFAVNCGSQSNRDQIIQFLGLKVTYVHQFNSDKTTRTDYANGLFSAFSNPNFASTLYFNAKNPLFTTAGAFLKINRKTGSCVQAKLNDYGQPKPVQVKQDLGNSSLSSLAVTTNTNASRANNSGSECLISIEINADKKPELLISFPNKECRNKWYNHFIALAGLLEINNPSSFFTTISNNSNMLRVSAAANNSLGVFEAESMSSSTLFQPIPTLGIRFAAPELKTYFVTSLDLESAHRQSSNTSHLYFKPELFSSTGNTLLISEYNSGIVASYDDIVPSTNVQVL